MLHGHLFWSTLQVTQNVNVTWLLLSWLGRLSLCGYLISLFSILPGEYAGSILGRCGFRKKVGVTRVTPLKTPHF